MIGSWQIRGASLGAWVLASALSLTPLVLPTAWAQTRFGDVTVSVQPPPASEGGTASVKTGGYFEHRIVVRNVSREMDHDVRLVSPTVSNGIYGDTLTRNSRSVRVAHGTTAVVSLFQPPMRAGFSETLAIEIDGRRQETVVPMPNPLDFNYYYSRRPPLIVLASRGIPQELKDQLRAEHRPAASGSSGFSGSSGGEEEIAFLRSELAVGQWSPNWLGYTCYDAVLLTEQEAASLPADVVSALRRYVESGGLVLVESKASDVKTAVPTALARGLEAPDEAGAFHVGFGLVRLCPKGPWPDEFWFPRSKNPAAPLAPALQVVCQADLPVRGLLLLVITFAIGIGPVNVWLLSRFHRKMWLWWIVPLVSIATCLLVFAYSIFSEGLSGRGRSQLITFLDENVHNASTIGYLSYYCPLTPSGGLHFSYDTVVMPLSKDYAPYGNVSPRSRTMDWTVDQHLDSGWIMSRVPTYLAVRMNEVRRERMPIRKAADGTLTVVNGLGADVDSFFYRDEDGTAYVATELPAGAERKLEKATPTASDEKPNSLRTVYEQSWEQSFTDMVSHPESFVAPGCYLAVVKKSPFLANPLRTAASLSESGVIYGVCERAGNGR